MVKKYPSNAAAAAFKKVLRETGLTQRAVSAKTGISQPALTKFVMGRPLTADFIQRLMSAFPEPQAREILIGHLHDEITRAGFDPASFYVLNREPDLFIIRGDLGRMNPVQASAPAAAATMITSETAQNCSSRDID
jgi:transcriptional regulator with XRE-family HTH domain